MSVKPFLRVASLVVMATLVSASAPESSRRVQQPVSVTVFKDAGCGCCRAWVDHLKEHAFEVVARDTSDVPAVKRTAGVPQRLHSCHTAFVNGYVIEGHVPAADIKRLLKERPRVAGLAVPGMPIGSPGMEVGDRKDRYEVIAFGRDGSAQVFSKY